MKPVKQSQLFDCLATVMSGSEDGDSPATRAENLITRHSLTEKKFAAGGRVLIAEDNPVNQKVTRRQVEKLGYAADVVANGLEALDALSKSFYDIVLMDCQMPEMDGYAATFEIRRREDGTGRRAVIIALTANAMDGESDKCFAAGMDDYLSKPLDVAKLQETLARWQVSAEKVEAAPNGNGNHQPEQISSPVNIERLRDAAGDDEDLMRELIELYLEQMTENIGKLKAAVETGAAAEIEPLAHTMLGASATCGITSIIEPLRQLEQIQSGEKLSETIILIVQIEKEFERVREYLEDFLLTTVK